MKQTDHLQWGQLKVSESLNSHHISILKSRHGNNDDNYEPINWGARMLLFQVQSQSMTCCSCALVPNKALPSRLYLPILK